MVHVGVVRVADDALDDLGFRKAFLLCIDRGVFDAEVEQIACVLAVEDRIVCVVADARLRDVAR